MQIHASDSAHVGRLIEGCNQIRSWREIMAECACRATVRAGVLAERKTFGVMLEACINEGGSWN